MLYTQNLKYDVPHNTPLKIGAGTIKKDKAYHTCRYEVIQLLKNLEEFDGVYAKVVRATLSKRGDVYFVTCKFAGLTGKRGKQVFPIRNVSFKYKNKAFDFIIDNVDAANWPLYIGIFH